ncbi:ribonuclease D [Actinomadura sp. 7K534]|uniref:ribonuclease D n=1 Tax=Actinomadura sp. 7K534 TaxID=2530366 RepID=UPI001404F786|nr:ribonuclease D [Actinomadura sp. 7K534]
MKQDISIFRNDIPASLDHALRCQDVIAWDIETSGLDWKQERIGTCQLFTKETGPIIVQVGADRPARLCRLLVNPNVTKLFHHAMFDLRFMASAWQVRPANVECTKIASKLLWPGKDGSCYTLKGLLQQLLAIRVSKAARISDWTADTLTSIQVEYAVSDVAHLEELRSILHKKLHGGELFDLYRRCVEFLPTQVELEIGDWSDVFTY